MPTPNRTLLLASALIEQFHAAHVGLTPQLAVGLAELLTSGRSDGSTWRHVCERLGNTYTQLHSTQVNSLPADNILSFTASMHYVVVRLALPLISFACQMAGTSIIWGEEGRGTELSRAQYIAYCGQIEELLAQIARAQPGDANALPAAFWQDRVLALAGISSRPHSRNMNRLPLTSIPETGAMFRDRDPKKRKREALPPRIQITAARQVHHPRREEAGADGIRFSRRDDDISRMIPSEWTYPQVIRLDRLINTGFLVSKRPPIPIKLRDALIIAFCPPSVAGTPVGSVLKAMWLDLAARLAITLARSNLMRSELRWVEGGPRGHLRSLAAVIDAIPARTRLDRYDPESSGVYRAVFSRAVHWLPAMTDHAAHLESVKFEVSDLRSWYQMALGAQKDHSHWLELESKDQRVASTLPSLSSGVLALNRYAVVHAMHLAPADDTAIGSADDLYYEHVDHSSIVWAPALPGQDGWRFDGYNAGDISLPVFHGDPMSSVANALLTHWQAYLTEVLQHA